MDTMKWFLSSILLHDVGEYCGFLFKQKYIDRFCELGELGVGQYPDYEQTFIRVSDSLNKLDIVSHKMGQRSRSHKFDICGTEFSSAEELTYHENYSKFRRPGCCWAIMDIL
jgi:hypothetical protein